MSENYTVYMHRFPNGKVYIGMTSKKPEDRWKRGRTQQEPERDGGGVGERWLTFVWAIALN